MVFELKQFKKYKNSVYRILNDVKNFFFLLSIDMPDEENIAFKSVFITVLVMILNFTAFTWAKMITVNILGAIFGIFWGIIWKTIGFCIMIGFYFFVSLYYSVLLDDGAFDYSLYYIGVLSTIHLPLVVFTTNVPLFGFFIRPFYVDRILVVVQAFVSDYLMRKTILGNSDISFKKYMISTAFTLSCFVFYYYIIIYRLLIS